MTATAGEDANKNWREAMSANPKGRVVNLAWVVLAAGLALPTGIGSVLAAEPFSAGQIIEALKAPRVTRGFTSPADAARAAEAARFLDGLRNKPTNSLTTQEREKIVTIAKTKPSIDLEINFKYKSATIEPEAILDVMAKLGEA